MVSSSNGVPQVGHVRESGAPIAYRQGVDLSDEVWLPEWTLARVAPAAV